MWFVIALLTGLAVGFSQPRPAGPDVNLTGCLLEATAPGTFMLDEAKRNPRDADETGVRYLLTPVSDLKLLDNVGRQVQIAGVIVGEPQPINAPDNKLPKLGARRLTAVSEVCPEEDETSDSSVGGSGSSGGGGIGFAQLSMNGMGMGMETHRPRAASGLFAVVGDYAMTSSMSESINGVGSSFGNSGGQSIGQSIDQSGTQVPGSTTSGQWPVGQLGNLPTGNSGGTGSPGPLDPTSVGPTIAVNGGANAVAQIAGPSVTVPSLDASAAPSPNWVVNPEPTTLVLLGTGLLLAGYATRRRRSGAGPAV